ncbi:hypothetical protein MRB53_020477 [Persea americana]|uniref:Uncharacterized protein n=1 Tax=Persea americana TaxID=3435 RepID=A0ACC2L1N4_PERAE|nr:hypothetical protein MRB53_020477 [Persea americana]
MGSLTLTPGNLLKLLHTMNSDAKVSGDHRSVLLQVLSIAPTPSTNHPFFIQLSDSAHSTYVYLSDPDNNLVIANRIQPGQFAYVDRLQFDSPPVPCAFGLRPIPGLHPFVGNPKPLIAQLSPSKRGFVIQPVSDDEIGEPGVVISAKENTPMENYGGGGRMDKRQLLSGCGRSVSVGKRGSGPPPLAERENSPARKSHSRPPSPMPSKCEVSSIVATIEDRRRPMREMAIMVPSRYRQQSPSGQKQESPRGRSSLSPGRMLHGGLKVLPGVSDTEMKKKMVVGISKVSDALVGSTKNMGKSLEVPGGADVEQKEKGVLGNMHDSQVKSRARAAFRTQSSDSHVCQSNLEDLSVNEKASSSCKIENLPPNLRKLGKDALHRRSLASAAAAAALEEASATEAVIRNLSMFSHLCSLSSKARNHLPIINQFLALYEDTVKSTVTAEMLTAHRSSSDNHREAASTASSQGRLKSIYLWIEAALASDLEAISLRVNQTENLPDFQKLEKPIALSPPRTKTSSRHSLTTVTKKHPKVTSPSTLSSESLTWVRGHGVEETAELAKNLQREMQVWFLGFMEEALDAGLQVSGKSSANENGQLAAILSHLKLVNEWLDRAGRNREEGSMEKMERLKQKIYGFVMQRVGTAMGGLNSNETS